MAKSILIAEDEPGLCRSLAALLSDEGYIVTAVNDGREAFSLILDQPFDIVITDVRMPEMDGVTLLGNLQRTAPQTPVIVITAFATVEDAVSTMRAGAFDYLQKPIDFDGLLAKVERAIKYGDLCHTRDVLTDQLAADVAFENMVGDSSVMTRLFEMVQKLSMVKSTVLVHGESGTGKELIARAVHYNGVTRDKPFVAVNCGAIPETLIESELFGYIRGAFTGATRDKQGYFEAADGGTLFLDEISTLPVAVQSSLLRVLEQRTVTRVGDTKTRPVDVRIIAASNRDMNKMVAEGSFREDLMYRLAVVKLDLPPLRQRREDIPALVQHFLYKYTQEMNKGVPGVSNEAMRAMLCHKWPGNVRELANVVERAVIFNEGRPVDVSDLPFAEAEVGEHEDENLKSALRQFERQHIMYCLRHHHYDKASTASHLGIGVSSLYRKMDELGIPKNQAKEEVDSSSHSAP
ncbi:MAG: sigma-54-dependent transcriptional regulator [Planctomycetota bacterium]|jgi:two-component system response regulator PilR (NtrC family)